MSERLRVLNTPGTRPELRNVVERGLNLARERWIEAGDLSAEIATCVAQAAEQAGVSRQGLHRILQRHGLTAPEFRGRTSGE